LRGGFADRAAGARTVNADFQEGLVEFDCQGSLLTTHASQGSDPGLFGGLLGWGRGGRASAWCAIRIEAGDAGDGHPDTGRLTLRNARRTKHAHLPVAGLRIEGVPSLKSPPRNGLWSPARKLTKFSLLGIWLKDINPSSRGRPISESKPNALK